jgi:hypothetical protein
MPSSDPKYEKLKGTTTMNMNTKQQEQRQKSKKHHQQWALAISLVAFVILLLSRNQDGQNLILQLDEDLVPEESSSPRIRSAHPRIRRISILGERNSGTRWTFEYVLYSLLSILERNRTFCRITQTHRTLPLFDLQSYFRVFQSFFRSRKGKLASTYGCTYRCRMDGRKDTFEYCVARLYQYLTLLPFMCRIPDRN